MRQLCPRSLLLMISTFAFVMAGGGCGSQAPVKNTPRYATLERKTGVPAYMRGTIWELTDPDSIDPFVVTSYGLVVNLRNTGDTSAPTAVHDWIVKQMQVHGWASGGGGAFKKVNTEQVLADPRVGIVLVGGNLQPGARKGQRFDIQVNVMPGNNTRSLAHGVLYGTELRVNGANPLDPGGAVNVMAWGEGQVFVNPSYALNGSATRPTDTGLRNGTILNGGMVAKDRPLDLRVRQPDWSTANLIVQRLNQRFQGVADRPSTVNLSDFVVAEGQDEAFIHLYVPRSFNGDWQRFLGVATHTYVNNSPDFLLAQARLLAGEAIRPNAALQDIAYCWEAIGPQALPYIRPLLASSSPEVMFAAAQAATFLHDPAGQERLMAIARMPGNPYQIPAIHTLGQLGKSQNIDNVLAELLDSHDPQPRVEAYRILARHGDAHVLSNTVNEKAFILDLIDSKGPPLVWAARSGEPRLAVFGRRLSLQLPLTFTAFDHQLSITSNSDQRKLVTIFDRTDVHGGARTTVSPPELVTIIRLLAGEGPKDDHESTPRMSFAYGDIVAIVRGLVDQKQVVDVTDRRYVPAAFVMQEAPSTVDDIEESPGVPEVLEAPTTQPATDPAQFGVVPAR